MLGMAGLCPPLIGLIHPYISALSQIKSLLFGHSSTGHDKTISAFTAGLAVALEKISLQPGEYWKPYTGEVPKTQVAMALNQIANAELDFLKATSAAIESDKLSPVFKTLFETCLNLSFTEAFLPATFPAFAAAPGALADALMAKDVYSTLATKIEATWKKTWAMFEGKEMSSASGTTSRYASSSWSTSSASMATDLDDPLGLFSDDDFQDTWIDQVPMHAISSSFIGSAQGHALLVEFRAQLSLALTEMKDHMSQALNDPTEASKIYAELMLRQINMLERLFL